MKWNDDSHWMKFWLPTKSPSTIKRAALHHTLGLAPPTVLGRPLNLLFRWSSLSVICLTSRARFAIGNIKAKLEAEAERNRRLLAMWTSRSWYLSGRSKGESFSVELEVLAPLFREWKLSSRKSSAEWSEAAQKGFFRGEFRFARWIVAFRKLPMEWKSKSAIRNRSHGRNASLSKTIIPTFRNYNVWP
jgi:hypothetical protein